MEHHDLYIQIFTQYAEVVKKYGFNGNITIHPPNLDDHKDVDKVTQALLNTNQLLKRLGTEAESNNWNMVIGVENQPMPKINNYDIDTLGYDINHFDIMLKGTNKHIQITLDSGHRLLAEDFSASEIVEWCQKNDKYLTNFYFHQNDGINLEITEKGKSCDVHDVAIPGGVHGYKMYLGRAILENIPLNLEVNFKNYSQEQILEYVSFLRKDIDFVFEEINHDLDANLEDDKEIKQ